MPCTTLSLELALDNVSTEFQLLAAAARTRMDSFHVKRINSLLSRGVHWDHFLQLARVHRLLPTVHSGLNTAVSSELPDGVREALISTQRAAAMRNLYLMNEIQRLSEAFESTGVQALFFKGPVLASDAYGGLGCRMPGDIDVLIDPRAIQRAEETLTTLGFAPFPKIQRIGPRRRRLHLRIARQFPYRSAHRVDLDLHVGVVSAGYRLDASFEEFASRARTLSISGISARTFSVEDLLLVLAFQGVTNRWAILKYACDIAELMTAHPQVDVDVVVQRANEAGALRLLCHALHLTEVVLNVPNSDTRTWCTKHDSQVEMLTNSILPHIPAGRADQMRFGQRFAYYTSVQDDFAGKIRYGLFSVLRRALTPTANT